MSVINILAKLPSDIKERISNPSALRINNDFPGLYVPKENAQELSLLLKELRTNLESNKRTNKIEKQINIINEMTDVIDKKILA